MNNTLPTGQVLVPDAPPVPGLAFRPIRGESDAQALYAVHVGRMAHDGVDPVSTYEDCPTLAGLASDLSSALAEGRQDH